MRRCLNYCTRCKGIAYASLSTLSLAIESAHKDADSIPTTRSVLVFADSLTQASTVRRLDQTTYSNCMGSRCTVTRNNATSPTANATSNACAPLRRHNCAIGFATGPSTTSDIPFATRKRCPKRSRCPLGTKAFAFRLLAHTPHATVGPSAFRTSGTRRLAPSRLPQERRNVDPKGHAKHTAPHIVRSHTGAISCICGSSLTWRLEIVARAVVQHMCAVKVAPERPCPDQFGPPHELAAGLSTVLNRLPRAPMVVYGLRTERRCKLTALTSKQVANNPCKSGLCKPARSTSRRGAMLTAPGKPPGRRKWRSGKRCGLLPLLGGLGGGQLAPPSRRLGSRRAAKRRVNACCPECTS